MATIYYRGSVAEVVRALTRLPALLAGAPGGAGIARGLLLRLGVTALSLVKQRFEALSRSGAYGPTGERWAPLAPATIAARRRPRGVPTRYRARQRVAAAALRLQRTRRGSKAQAAALEAYQQAQKKAALAYAPVQIGVDTGAMRASLSPGLDGPSGDRNQVFRLGPGRVSVGTRLFYAAYFHGGTRRQPARPLWPANPGQVWSRPLGEAARTGVIRAIELLLAGRGPP